jgi:glucokinase
MQGYTTDKRVVLTLDAGGTNFDFAALRGSEEASAPVRLPSNADDLDRCLQTTIDGFQSLIDSLDEAPVAISFAFPGPADYEKGIIGDLNNLPAFRGGVPLKAILERKFNLPVFINNDANLFVYGEAIAGMLPEVNAMLKAANSKKQYRNLAGVTLGTGFGGGFVLRNQLLVGDNSLGGEIWLSSSPLLDRMNAEEAISIRAIVGGYAELAGIPIEIAPTPRIIAEIARGDADGDMKAAKKSYKRMGKCLGDVLANLMTFTDSLVVIGGGIAYAHDLFFPAMLKRMRRPFDIHGSPRHRLVQEIYNLEDVSDRRAFLHTEQRKVEWEGLETQYYDPKPNLAIGVSRLGTRKATSIGAYAIALAHLDGELD